MVGLEPVGNPTVDFMDGDLLLLIDVSHHQVTRNRFTAIGEHILSVECLVVDDDAFLLVYFLLRFRSALLLVLPTLLFGEREKAFPSATSASRFFLHGIHFLASKLDASLCNIEVELLHIVKMMELADFLHAYRIVRQFLLLKESFDGILSCFSLFILLFSKNGMDLVRGLGRRGHFQPFLLYLERVGSKNLHLVATIELMAHRHKFMVHLCSDAMAPENGMDGEGKVEHGASCRKCL